MKLPIQKSDRRKESISSYSAEDMWPMARSFVEKIFPEDFIKPWLGWEKGMYSQMETWTPRVDISETDREFIIDVDVPGVKPEDIKVETSEDNLIIKGKTEEEKEEKGKTWHRTERRFGSFYREFELPKSADMGKIDATAKNGMLVVKVLKMPESQNKMIQVKTDNQSPQPPMPDQSQQ